jgi:SAM-dependent methyltransferase
MANKCNISMDTAHTQTQSHQAKTRRLLRTRGQTRRKVTLGGGPVKLNTDAASAVLAPIYNSLQATKASGQHNLTYGEIEWPTLKFMVDYVEKTPSSVKGRFYDLGCGRGRAVLYMALAGPFEQSVGIEVLPERVTLAQQALNALKTSIPSAGAKVRLYEASFMNPAFKYRDARAVYLSNLAFDNETQDAIFKKLTVEMPKGSLLFCNKAPVPIPAAFELLAVERMPMSWTPTSDFHILRHL